MLRLLQMVGFSAHGSAENYARAVEFMLRAIATKKSNSYFGLGATVRRFMAPTPRPNNCSCEVAQFSRTCSKSPEAAQRHFRFERRTLIAAASKLFLRWTA